MPNNTVILVPGFLGSVLGYSGRFNLINVVWLNPTAILAGYFPRLRLAVPDDPDPPPPAWSLEPGHPLPLYYGLLCAYLAARGWRVVTPYADWRRPMLHDALILADLIRSEASRSPVQLLCHSRGGLVARTALALLEQSGQLSLVSRVITMGTPHAGSMTAAINLACWSQLKARLVNLGSGLPTSVYQHLGFGQVREIIRSWPAMYELLPPVGAAWVDVQPADAVYLQSTWADSPLRPVQSYLDAARTRWATFPPLQSGVDWVLIYGRSLWTPTGIPDIRRVLTPGSFSGDEDGDGVVPIASAWQTGRRYVSTPCNHDLLPEDGRVWPYLHAALRGALTSDVVIEGRTLTI